MILVAHPIGVNLPPASVLSRDHGGDLPLRDTILVNPEVQEPFMVTSTGSVNGLSDETEIARRPLEAERCTLIVVDIQEKLLPPIFQKERLIKNARLLIRVAGILKLPTLATTQYAKGLGGTVPEIGALLPDTQAIDKHMFSCFGSDVLLGDQAPARPSQYRATVRDGISHLRDADRARRPAGGIPGACCVGCCELPHRMELENRVRAHARGRRGDLFHGDDDVRIAALFQQSGVQRAAAVFEGVSKKGVLCDEQRLMLTSNSLQY